MTLSVQQRVDALPPDVFLGGPRGMFERVGRHQFSVLIQEGVNPSSKVVDVGCGALRAGYWLIHFLDPGCYYGIEPNREMLELGLDYILEPGLVDHARPSFAHNDDFDLSIFDVRFDFVLARSVWSHAAKPQIEAMLDSFAAVATDDAKLLASYLPARWGSDYKGLEWIGRSHTGRTAGVVKHSKRWLKQACDRRDLSVLELQYEIINRQRWVRIQKRRSATP